MRLLVDMDGVLANFEGELARRWNERHGDRVHIDVSARRHFRAIDDFPEWEEPIRAIQTERGFVASLPPLPGAIPGIQALADAGHDVWILTAHLRAWHNCVAEKFEWVDRYLGPRWTDRVMLAKPKWLVAGDRLLDDKPDPMGGNSAAWEHVVFDAPYNQDSRAFARVQSWADTTALTADWFDHVSWQETPLGPAWIVVKSERESVLVVRNGEGRYTIRARCGTDGEATRFAASMGEGEVRAIANTPTRAMPLLMESHREWTVVGPRGDANTASKILDPSDGYRRSG